MKIDLKRSFWIENLQQALSHGAEYAEVILEPSWERDEDAPDCYLRLDLEDEDFSVVDGVLTISDNAIHRALESEKDRRKAAA